MAFIQERRTYNRNIYLIDEQDFVEGGENGIDNRPHQELANRTNWLKHELEQLKKQIKKQQLPIGTIIGSEVHYRKASDFAKAMGYGVWERTLEGRIPVGFSTNRRDPKEFKTFGAKYGEFEHTLTVDEMPNHKHSQNNVFNRFVAKGSDVSKYVTSDVFSPSHNDDDSDNEIATTNFTKQGWNLQIEQSKGGGQAHNNMQPSQTIDWWKRIK